MLGKLLKYDLRSMLKTFLLVWGAALVLAFVNLFTLRRLEFDTCILPIASILKAVSLFIYIAILVAMTVLTWIFVIQRFYNGLLKDEGYLMFTLPVKPWQLVTAKGIAAVAVNVISGLVAVGSVLIVAPWDKVAEATRSVFAFLRDNGIFSGGQLAVLFAEAALLFLFTTARSIYQVYAAIALGHLFRKHRVGMAFVMYLVINTVLSTAGSLILSTVAVSDALWGTVSSLLEKWTAFGLLNLALWFYIVVSAIHLAAFHVVTERILSKKLNLE